MTRKSIQFSIAIIASLLVVIVLLFTGVLNIGSFRKNYVDSLVASYSVAGGEARRKIEYAVKFHKPLENFAGMAEILAGIRTDTPAIQAVNVVLPDGTILYDLGGRAKDQKLPDRLKAKVDFREFKGAQLFSWTLWEGKYHSFLPIRDAKGAWIGTLDLIFDSSEVENRTGTYLRETVKIMVLIALGAILLIGLALARINVFESDGKLNKRKLSTVLVLVLILAQIAYGLINVSMFRTAYLQIVQENTSLTADIIRKTVEKVSGLGVPYTDLVGIDDWLGKIVQSVKEIERIDLTGATDSVLYSTATGKRAPVSAGYLLSRALKPDVTGAKAGIAVIISEAYVRSRIFNLALDAVTMLITSIFFMVEAIVFMTLLLKRQMAGEMKGLSAVGGLISGEEEGATGFIRNLKSMAAKEEDISVRPLAFLVLLCGYMSVSFIPVMMKDLYRPLFGLSPQVVLGLPIVAEMFGAFLSSLFIGAAIDKRGWRPPFMAGLVVMGLGTLASAMVWDAVSFIGARGIVGLGYGAAWMGLRGLVAAGQSAESRTKGFSILNAGIFAGQNCGAVLGAMLAERMGFPKVFVFAAVIAVIAATFALSFVTNVRPAGAGTPGPSKDRMKGFFSDGNLIAFFLLVTIPSAIAGTFLNYFFPLYAKSIGVTQGNIGRAFLVYGICIIFVGPFLIKKLGKKYSGRQIMTAAGIVGVLALAAFCSKATFAGAVVAIILLGISDSIGLVSQNSYFVNLPASQNLGHGKALSFFSAIKKVGQMVGPGAFGWAAALGAVTGVATIAGGYLAATAAFVFLTRRSPQDPKQGEIEEVEG